MAWETTDGREQVWVTEVHHKYGHDTYLNKTEEGARKALYNYVENEWNIAGQGPIPEDMEQAIKEYFAFWCEEEYSTCDTFPVGD